MSFLTSTWHELVRRRLLPVAILLLAALVAVPFLLAKSPEPSAPPPVAHDETSPAKTAADTTAIVSALENGERTKRRRVLGARKDPFAPAPVKVAPVATASAPSTKTSTPPVAIDKASDTGGKQVPAPVTGPSIPVVVPPPLQTPTTPTAPKRHHELYSLVVRFGSSSSDTLDRMSLARLKALPSAEEPILVYLGVSGDKKSAIFMVDANVEAQGDGVCDPHPNNCETIRLREGETEFFDVLDEDGEVAEQYQLDLIKIRRSTKASSAAAKAARAKVADAGRRVLRRREVESGPLRWDYDAKSGTVHKLGRRAYKALVAKTARISLAFSGGF